MITDNMESIIIFLVSFLTYLLVSKILDFAGRKRAIEIQNEINTINKEYLKYLKEGNEKKIKEYEEKMKGTSKLMIELLIINLKSTLLILPVLIGVPYAIKTIFPNFQITLPFPLPVIKLNNFSFEIRNNFGSYGWFFISFLASGIIIFVYKKLEEKIKNKK